MYLQCNASTTWFLLVSAVNLCSFYTVVVHKSRSSNEQNRTKRVRIVDFSGIGSPTNQNLHDHLGIVLCTSLFWTIAGKTVAKCVSPSQTLLHVQLRKILSMSYIISAHSFKQVQTFNGTESQRVAVAVVLAFSFFSVSQESNTCMLKCLQRKQTRLGSNATAWWSEPSDL